MQIFNMNTSKITTARPKRAVLLIAIISLSTLIICVAMSGCNANNEQGAGQDTQTSQNSGGDNSADNNANNYYNMEFHRGGRDLRPENTLYSYAYALQNGATTIECDMNMTADDEIVLTHDPLLDPVLTKDEQGNYVGKYQYDVRTMNYDDVCKFNVGEMDTNSEYYQLHGKTQIRHEAQVPTLRQLFELIRDSGNTQVKVDAEFKTYPDPNLAPFSTNNVDTERFTNAVNALVKEYNMEDRFVAQSFDWSTLVAIKKLNPKITTSALYSEESNPDTGNGTLRIGQSEKSPWLAGLDIKDFNNSPVEAAHSLGIDILSPCHTEVSAEEVAAAHAYGMKVVVWTVNTVEDMQTAFDKGVDGIMSDNGDMLRSFLESKNVSLMPKLNFESEYIL